MNDDRLLTWWRYLATTVTIIALATIGSCQTTKLRIVEAIEAGANPLEAHCALSIERSTDCNIIFAKELQ